MVDRAGHLEDDPGVAPLLPPRARLARSPTVALVAAAMLSGAVVWRRSRTGRAVASRLGDRPSVPSHTRRARAGGCQSALDRSACPLQWQRCAGDHGPRGGEEKGGLDLEGELAAVLRRSDCAVGPCLAHGHPDARRPRPAPTRRSSRPGTSRPRRSSESRPRAGEACSSPLGTFAVGSIICAARPARVALHGGTRIPRLTNVSVDAIGACRSSLPSATACHP